MSLKYMNRRHFLIGMGNAALALPFLSSLAPQEALAATAPKRVVFVYSLHGVFGNQFFPSVAADKQVANQFEMYYRMLKDIPGPLSTVFGSQFDSVRDKMNIMRGFEVHGDGRHNRTAFLSARCDGDHNAIKNQVQFYNTADVIIENSPAVYGGSHDLKALRLKSTGEKALDSGDACSWIRSPVGQPRQPFWDTSDTAAFRRVFPGGASGGGTNNPPPPTNSGGDKLLTDLLVGAYNSLKNHRRISSADKVRLEEHMDRVHELNKAVVQPADPPMQVGCNVNAQTAYAKTRPVRELYSNYIDLIVSAFACDRTRVACLFIPHFGDSFAFPQVDPSGGMTTAHLASHFYWWDPRERTESTFSGDAMAAYAGYYQWVSARVSELVQKLNGTVDSDGQRVLDNTLVVWGNENGEAPHTNRTHPIVTAGSLGGAFKTGYYFDFRARPLPQVSMQLAKSRGRPLTQMLISVMRGMGVAPSEYMSEGDEGGFGGWKADPEDREAINRANRHFGSSRNSSLPFIFNS